MLSYVVLHKFQAFFEVEEISDLNVHVYKLISIWPVCSLFSRLDALSAQFEVKVCGVSYCLCLSYSLRQLPGSCKRVATVDNADWGDVISSKMEETQMGCGFLEHVSVQLQRPEQVVMISIGNMLAKSTFAA